MVISLAVGALLLSWSSTIHSYVRVARGSRGSPRRAVAALGRALETAAWALSTGAPVPLARAAARSLSPRRVDRGRAAILGLLRRCLVHGGVPALRLVLGQLATP